VPRLTLEDEYWCLVHQLMIHGWYRVGQGPVDDLGRAQWGFREGHLCDGPSSAPLWIPAPDECSAMRILLKEVESVAANQASRNTYELSTTSSAPMIPAP
jgi:hypothetical protein